MKRVIAVLMCILLAGSMVGCQKKTGDSKKAASEDTATEQAAKAESTEDVEGDKENMIENGDFSGGQGAWNTYTNGGSASLSVTGEEKQLKISITSVGSVEHGVQAYYDGFGLDSGCKYKLSFDISADTERTAEWRIQLNGGDYHAYVSDKIPISSEVTHVEKEFEMTEASDPLPRLCLNLGMVEGCPGDLGEHSVFVDNFELYLMDSSNKAEEADAVKVSDINLNQVGYRINDIKKAVLRGDSFDEEFEVVNVDSGKTVYTGKITEEQDNAYSAEHVAIADFSDVKEEGTYKLVTKSNKESAEFDIGDSVYKELFKDSFRMMYLQRCGVELKKEQAGDYAHPSCHSSKATIYGTDKKKDVSGGWHDAGDYGRYVVSGAKTVADLLLAYEQYPKAFSDDMGIPESGNGVSDVLDEVRYELDWMFKMQDEKSGGVYHKVTCKQFPGEVMPEAETEELIICPVSNTATGDFAAVMAMAARVYKDVDGKYADKCLKAAGNAYKYLMKHREEGGFHNPSDITTGEYPDENCKDEVFWALAELYKTTGDKMYHKQLKKEEVLSAAGGLGWAEVGYYGVFAYLTSKDTDADYKKQVQDRIDYAIKDIVEKSKKDAYASTLGDTYPWGSNMSFANNAMLLLMSDSISGNAEYNEIAKEQLNYLLGKNSNGYCFVTGYGAVSPEHTHHRPSQALDKTMKGMLVGGANSNLEDTFAKALLQGEAPAKCYVDNEQSYSCNEVTVYWNSPLVYVLSVYTK